MVAIEEWHKADSIGGPDQDLGNGYSSRQELLGRTALPKSHRVHTQGIVTRTPSTPYLFEIIFPGC